jgi:hypothetical protein
MGSEPVNRWEIETVMIGYEREIIHRELSRLQRDIGKLLRELPDTGDDAMPKETVTGMAIAYKLVSAMIGARVDRVTESIPERKYPAR